MIALSSAQPDSHSRLLSAAREVFASEGYQASLDRVAARAGVARQTVYNHFATKAQLFSEVVRQSAASILYTLAEDDAPLRKRLIDFGNAYRDRLLSAEGLGLYRTLVAESRHFPELVGGYYQAGPARTQSRLAEVMRAAVRAGELCDAEPEAMATLLLSMLVGSERTRYLLSGEPPPKSDPALVVTIIDAFLRAFAPLGNP